MGLDTKWRRLPEEPASDRLVEELRADILAGRFPVDERIAEDAIARNRGLSRTPVRHALRALELEGLLHRQPRRGYRVRSYTIDEVADAIEVRGELEAMAARIQAEAGWTAGTRDRLVSLATEGAKLAGAAKLGRDIQIRWAALNLEFHDALVGGTGKMGLMQTYELLKRMPLVSPRAMLFERHAGEKSRRQLNAAQADHERLIKAIDERKGQRAAEIMRDHAIRSGEAKRENAEALLANRLVVGELGAALVRNSARDDVAERKK